MAGCNKFAVLLFVTVQWKHSLSLDLDGSCSSADTSAALLQHGKVRTNKRSTGVDMENAMVSSDDVVHMDNSSQNQVPDQLTWDKSTNVFSGEECPSLGNLLPVTLDECKSTCVLTPKCTAFNIRTEGTGPQFCTFRQCSFPVVPPMSMASGGNMFYGANMAYWMQVDRPAPLPTPVPPTQAKEVTYKDEGAGKRLQNGGDPANGLHEFVAGKTAQECKSLCDGKHVLRLLLAHLYQLPPLVANRGRWRCGMGRLQLPHQERQRLREPWTRQMLGQRKRPDVPILDGKDRSRVQ